MQSLLSMWHLHDPNHDKQYMQNDKGDSPLISGAPVSYTKFPKRKEMRMTHVKRTKGKIVLVPPPSKKCNRKKGNSMFSGLPELWHWKASCYSDTTVYNVHSTSGHLRQYWRQLCCTSRRRLVGVSIPYNASSDGHVPFP